MQYLKAKGLIYGSFFPFHKGHEQFMRAALTVTPELYILVLGGSGSQNVTDFMKDYLSKKFKNESIHVVAGHYPPRIIRSHASIKAFVDFLHAYLDVEIDEISHIYGNEQSDFEITEILGKKLVTLKDIAISNDIRTELILENPEKYANWIDEEMLEAIKNLPIKTTENVHFDDYLKTEYLDKNLSSNEVQQLKRGLQFQNPNSSNEEILTMPVWDLALFEKQHLPIIVGSLQQKKFFSKNEHLRILDMAIRMPGEDWKIPKNLAKYMETLEAVWQNEKLINPDFLDCYVYITVDQKIAVPGKSQRRNGYHSDSFITHSTKFFKEESVTYTESTYVVYDELPTKFHPGPFPIQDLDPEDCPSVLRRFDEISKQQELKVQTFPSYTILKMTPYVVHSTAINDSPLPLQRTFVKISISKEKFNYLGNEINPFFTYAEWSWKERDPFIRNHKNHISQ